MFSNQKHKMFGILSSLSFTCFGSGNQHLLIIIIILTYSDFCLDLLLKLGRWELDASTSWRVLFLGPFGSFFYNSMGNISHTFTPWFEHFLGEKCMKINMSVKSNYTNEETQKHNSKISHQLYLKWLYWRENSKYDNVISTYLSEKSFKKSSFWAPPPNSIISPRGYL